jgi:RNA-directed DNA polymerase
MVSSLNSFAATQEEIFGRVVSAPALYQAWRKVRANRGAAGVDAVSLQVFEERLHENLRELARGLSSGAYQPMPARFVTVRKDDGRERELAILTVRD